MLFVEAVWSFDWKEKSIAFELIPSIHNKDKLSLDAEILDSNEQD